MAKIALIIAYTLPGGLVSSLDSRAEYNQQLIKLREENDDFYTATRAFYLQKRKNEINALRGITPQNFRLNLPFIAPENSMENQPSRPPPNSQIQFKCR